MLFLEFIKEILPFLLALGILACTLIYYFIYDVYSQTLKYQNIKIRFPNLPKKLDKVTIAHISDLHLYESCVSEKILSDVALSVYAQKPFATIITGDIIQKKVPYAKKALDHLMRRMPGDVISIFGNHDYKASKSYLKSLLEYHDVVVLENAETHILNNIRYVAVSSKKCGINDPAKDVESLKNDPKNFTIVLSHSPDSADIISKKLDFDCLVLAGHTHGGQICIPTGRKSTFPILKLLPWSYNVVNKKYFDGVHIVNNKCILNVNRGIGAHFRLRLFCPPTVSFITLERGDLSYEIGEIRPFSELLGVLKYNDPVHELYEDAKQK